MIAYTPVSSRIGIAKEEVRHKLLFSRIDIATEDMTHIDNYHGLTLPKKT